MTSPYSGQGGLGDGDGCIFSDPAHLHFIIKYLLPHHIALVIIRDDVQQPGEERSISKCRSAVCASPLGAEPCRAYP